MRRSDQQSSQLDDFNGNASLDETANSIHQQNLDQDKDMFLLNPVLERFVWQELRNQLKLDDLQHQQHIFKQRQCVVVPPVPSLYFMPHHILVFNRSLSGPIIRDSIQKLQKEYVIRYYSEKDELNIKLHNKAELVYYNIKVLKNDPSLHRKKQFLDPRHLIDKLFQYYCDYYQRLHFQETASLILYWAYQKEIINEQLTYHVLKLLVICNFINFGYGVPNVINLTMSNQQILKENNKMIAYAKINPRGETQIDEELMKKYINYTIEEKRGFYIASKKKFMQIKDIIPICFPLVPLTSQKDVKQREEARKNIGTVVDNQRQKMSICKNIYKIFKFLHNKFDKRMKLVIDFEQKLAYRHDFAENFQLEVLHPVLNTSICIIKDQSIRRIKSQINSIYEGFVKSSQPLNIIKQMLSKKRY